MVKYSKLSVKDIDKAIKENVETDHVCQEAIVNVDSIAADLHLDIFPDENNAFVIFNESGYCCRSLIKRNKCESCKEATVAAVDDVSNEINFVVPENAVQFFEDINRGGLRKPNLETFQIGTLCWRIFFELSKNDLRQQFLSSLNHRDVFTDRVATSWKSPEFF